MIYTPTLVASSPEKFRAWSFSMVFADERYYLFCGVMDYKREAHARTRCGFSVAVSEDGVHFTEVEPLACAVENAEPGFTHVHANGRFHYYATISDPAIRDRTHVTRVYLSSNLRDWTPQSGWFSYDPEYYACRWDELHVMSGKVDGRYVGYITSETKPEHQYASCGMVRSDDLIDWEALPPPIIDWGDLPPQIMELCFVEKIGDFYYMVMGGRGYMDQLGYGNYVFRAREPEGPFVPVANSFRLSGTSTRDLNWIHKVVHGRDEKLVTSWFTPDWDRETEHGLMARGVKLWVLPLKKLAVNPSGELFLAYWPGNEAMKGEEIGGFASSVEPVFTGGSEDTGYFRAEFECLEDGVAMECGRNGMMAMAGKCGSGGDLVVEFNLRVEELRTGLHTHLGAAVFGLLIESSGQAAPGASQSPPADPATRGTMLQLTTHRLTRIGRFLLAGERIAANDEYADAFHELADWRFGPFDGRTSFIEEDSFSHRGTASASGVVHAREHRLRLLLRENLFELYIDDVHCQSYALEPGAERTGRIGFFAKNGRARVSGLRAWTMTS